MHKRARKRMRACVYTRAHAACYYCKCMRACVLALPGAFTRISRGWVLAIRGAGWLRGRAGRVRAASQHSAHEFALLDCMGAFKQLHQLRHELGVAEDSVWVEQPAPSLVGPTAWAGTWVQELGWSWAYDLS
jgi:hypothetical protein